MYDLINMLSILYRVKCTKNCTKEYMKKMKSYIKRHNKYPPVELGVFQFRVKPFVTSIA